FGLKQTFEGAILMSRRWLMFGASGVLSAGLILALMGCNRGSNAAQVPQRPPSVTVTDVVVQDVPYYLDAIGTCAGNKTVSIMPQIAGRVDEANFTEGDDVKKGDLLFTIDPRPFKAAVA